MGLCRATRRSRQLNREEIECSSNIEEDSGFAGSDATVEKDGMRENVYPSVRFRIPRACIWLPLLFPHLCWLFGMYRDSFITKKSFFQWEYFINNEKSIGIVPSEVFGVK